MAKKSNSSHTEAKEYLDTYTGKIREKFLSQKKEKALFELLKISPEKQEEESIRMKEEIKKFVQELQSDQNYAAMKKIYHEQMKNIHSFNRLIHDYTQEFEKLQIKEHTKLAKDKFFDENVNIWKGFVKKFKTTWDGLTPKQQQKTFEEMDKLMNDKGKFKEFIKKNKVAIKARSIIIGTLGFIGFMGWLTYFAVHSQHTLFAVGCLTFDFAFIMIGMFIGLQNEI